MSSNADIDIWMPLYIGDYLASTTHLTAAESGGYLHLLMHQWKNGSLPSDPEALRRISRIDADAWSIAWVVLKEFFAFDSGAPVQLRLERDRALWAGKKAKAVSKAQAAAAGRWRKPKDDAPGMPQALREECPSSSPSPVSTTTKTFARIQPSDDDLNLVYKAYPRKVGAMKAKAAIRKAVEHLGSGRDMPAMSVPDAVNFLQKKAARFGRSVAGQQGEYTPHPSTWFNEGRYLDDEAEWDNAGQQRGSGDAKSGSGNSRSGEGLGSAAVRRQRESHDNIRAAGARRYGLGIDDADGSGAGTVSEADIAGGDAGYVSGGMGGDGSQVRPGGVPGRVIESHP